MAVSSVETKSAPSGTTESTVAGWPLPVSRPGLAVSEKFLLRFFPSLSDFAFLAPIIMLFLVMSGTRNMLGDSDTGWHIRAGDWILEHGRFPTTDFFSFTKPGQPWYAWEWLWEISFAWLHRYTGMLGVILVCITVICLTSLLLFRFVRQQVAHDLIAFAVTLVAMFGMSLHFLARPHLFSMLFAVILLGMLERGRRAGRDVPWAAIPLIWLWVNVHPAFVAGVIILVAYTAGELVAALTSTQPEERRRLLKRFQRYCLLSAACVAVSLINPYGYHLFVHIFRFLSDPYTLQNVNEFMVVDFRLPAGRAFELMLMLGAPAALAHASKRQFAPLFLYIAWAHLALTSQRHVPFFMIAMAAPVALWIEQVLAKPPLPEWIRKPAAAFERSSAEFSANDRIPRFYVISVAVLVLLWLVMRTPGTPSSFQPGYDPAAFPAGALASLSRIDSSTRLFTTDVWGGYLIYRLYPQVRVFWDSRTDFYGTEFNQAALDTIMGRPGWDNTLAEHHITNALVPVNVPLAAILSESRNWRPVYRDKIAVLFEASAGRAR